MQPPPHSRDLRKGRHSEPNRIYLVTTITHQRQPLFLNFYAGRKVVHALRHEEQRAETLAYVVMPDHLHWLLRLESEATLERVVRNVKAFSARRINEAVERRGPVWQPGYHDRALRWEKNLVKLARYVVANPLRAGLVKRVGDYPLWDAVWL